MHNSKTSSVLIQKFLEENSFVGSTIQSFNMFLEKGLQRVLDENKVIEPTIIPQNVDSFKIRLDRVWVKKPEIIEADGSRRDVYPLEARMRKISYSAPLFVEISSHVNDVQRESFSPQICSIPIMLKSNFCHLKGLSRDELIDKGEDPDDSGGYFIVNGTERVLIHVEDLASNNVVVEHDGGTSEWVAKLFSEAGSYKIPHTLERLKDGTFYVSFSRVKRVPFVVLVKALGLLKDEEIMRHVSRDEQFDEVLINLFEFASIKTVDDALDDVGKSLGVMQTRESRIERAQEYIDRFLLPHIGFSRRDRIVKAYNICKMVKKFVLVSNGRAPVDDKDHYANKRLKLAGDLLEDLFSVNLKVLIGDLLYNFQRMVKRGKFPALRTLIREKLLTSRMYSAMATGNWVGARTGISQRIQRLNHLNTLSHLQRIVSPLSSSQENFAARELHPTHLGRVCPVETPEGTNIGLRKNLSMLASISTDTPEDQVLSVLKSSGLRGVEQ